MKKTRRDWGLDSPACLIGAIGATVASAARLIQEAAGANVQFMPVLDSMPGWVASDVTVVVAAIIGGAVGQIGCALFVWLKENP